ncbi:MAG: bifunctional riboflavin kinase/FAD synthetase [Candidatus Omnitrophota bacterium]
MRVIYGKLPSRRIGCVGTIGIFDGVHMGHRYIISKLACLSSKYESPSLVITFDYPPQLVLSSRFRGYLTDLEEKKSLFKSTGIDYLWAMKISPSLLKMSAEQYLSFVAKYFSLKHLIVGDDFRFGSHGKSGISDLKTFSRKYNFKLSVIKKKKMQKHPVSSTRIREYIFKGDFRRANKLLGRPYLVKGQVTAGRGFGTRIGFPTANINTGGHTIPRPGVYCAYAILGPSKYFCAVNIGNKPTFGFNDKITLEAHILNFQRNILGRNVKIIFLERIRNEKKFSSVYGLKAQIAKDIQLMSNKACNFHTI